MTWLPTHEGSWRELRRQAGESPPASDAEALANVRAVFSEVTVLPFERQPAKPKVLADADAALAEDDRASSWRAVDLQEHLRPQDDGDAPSILRRTDGQALLYRGKRNEIHAPYESGKSIAAGIAAVEVLRTGAKVAWLDFEDSPRSLTSRLLALGATEGQIIERFAYIQPNEPLTAATEVDLRLELVGRELVVIDAANEAMAAGGFDPNKNADIAAWYAKVPRLVTAAGATLLVLDHVAKHPEQQRGSVGGGHKQAAIDGASYRLEVAMPFGRGSAGLIRLRLTKDRQGFVRGWAGAGKEPVVAEIAIDGTNPEALLVEIRPPNPAGDAWRPTHLMEAVSRFLEEQDEPVSERTVRDGVVGRPTYVREALELLVRDGFVNRETGPRRSHLHSTIKPYREAQS